MTKLSLFICCCTILLFSCAQTEKSKFDIAVSFDENVSPENKDGRLLLMLSTDDSKEPRFQINDGLNTQLIFGMNVDNMAPGTSITFDESIFGYPYPSLKDVPPGEYNVQALLHVYETFNLSTGHTVKLPLDRQQSSRCTHPDISPARPRLPSLR